MEGKEDLELTGGNRVWTSVPDEMSFLSKSRSFALMASNILFSAMMSGSAGLKKVVGLKMKILSPARRAQNSPCLEP